MTVKRIAAIAVISILCGCSGFAVETPDAVPTAPSNQAREQMALLHEKIVACLRSDRALAECRSEMMHGCHVMEADRGEQGCRMGMMGRDRQDQSTADKAEHSDHKH
jgi:hypothetical protein